jgi:hypothetical protein
MTALRVLAAVGLALAASRARPAAAQPADAVTIGLFAPTAPFDGAGDRVAFVNALASHLAAEAGGARVTGKVYSSATAFSAAVKRRQIHFAVIDAPYAAALGLPADYRILGAAVRAGSSQGAWQLVGPARRLGRLADLRGKRVVVPSIGAREGAFVTNALLAGEVDAGYFAAILEAADARSALTMVAVGKADAAFVPAGLELPDGLARVMSLGQVGWPMFVALPAADEARARAFARRLASFTSTGAFTGFTAADAGRYRGLAARFSRGRKRGLMAVPPPARLIVRDLLEGRAFAIPPSNVLELVEAPTPPGP